MKLVFEYGKQKFTAELSDNEKNARLAINLAWDLVNEDTRLVFLPDVSKIQPYKPTNPKKLKKALLERATEVRK